MESVHYLIMRKQVSVVVAGRIGAKEKKRCSVSVEKFGIGQPWDFQTIGHIGLVHGIQINARRSYRRKVLVVGLPNFLWPIYDDGNIVKRNPFIRLINTYDVYSLYSSSLYNIKGYIISCDMIPSPLLCLNITGSSSSSSSNIYDSKSREKSLASCPWIEYNLASLKALGWRA